MSERKGKVVIVTLRRTPAMAAEAYYLFAPDEASASRRAKRLCRAPDAIVLGVTPDLDT